MGFQTLPYLTKPNKKNTQSKKILCICMSISKHNYQILYHEQHKIRKNALRKTNTHNVLEFDQRDTRFLVQETINLREVGPAGDFTVRLDKGGVIVANSRSCTCLVLMFLILVSMLIMSTKLHTSRVYVRKCLQHIQMIGWSIVQRNLLVIVS